MARLALLLLAVLAFSACDAPRPVTAPTADLEAVRATALHEALASVTAQAAAPATPPIQIVTVEVTRLVEVTLPPTATSTTTPPTSTPTAAPLTPADARASRFVGGNASPQLPDGEPGRLSVVAAGSYNGHILPVVVRNNTGEALARVGISAVAYGADNKMLATGEDQGFVPNYIAPGEIAMGYVYFGWDVSLPENVRFEFELTGDAPSAYENIRDLDFVQAEVVDNRLVGLLRNPYDEQVDGPIDATVYCFDEAGALLGYRSDFTAKEEVAPGENLPFQVAMGDTRCPVYLVAGSGFGELGFRQPMLEPALVEASATVAAPATATPAPAAAESTATPAPVATAALDSYTVQAGDSLAKIAQRLGLSVQALAAYNQIDDPGTILVGQVLQVPPSDYVIPTREAPTAAPAPAATDTPVTAAPTEAAPTPPPAQPAGLLALGQTAQVGTWEITAREVHWEKALYFYSRSIIAMGKYLVVIFDARNLSPGTDYFRRTMNMAVFDETTGNWHKYTSRSVLEAQADGYAEWEFGGKSSAYDDVAPGATVSIAVVFDMPETLTGAQFDVGPAADQSSIVSFALGDISQVPPYKPQ